MKKNEKPEVIEERNTQGKIEDKAIVDEMQE